MSIAPPPKPSPIRAAIEALKAVEASRAGARHGLNAIICAAEIEYAELIGELAATVEHLEKTGYPVSAKHFREKVERMMVKP